MCERRSVAYFAERTVINDIAAVGAERLTVRHAQLWDHARVAERVCDRSDAGGRRAMTERDDFDGQGKRAEALYELAVISDDDHAGGGGCNDLLAQERAATALDQI